MTRHRGSSHQRRSALGACALLLLVIGTMMLATVAPALAKPPDGKGKPAPTPTPTATAPAPSPTPSEPAPSPSPSDTPPATPTPSEVVAEAKGALTEADMAADRALRCAQTDNVPDDMGGGFSGVGPFVSIATSTAKEELYDAKCAAGV